MRVAARLFVGGAVFFSILAALYWFTSHDPAGSTMLATGIPATLLIGGYLARQAQTNKMDSTPERVRVPARSLWPVGLAAGAGTFAAGLVLGTWLLVPGAMLLAASIIGVVLGGRNYPPASR